jgi:DNA-binding NtrC family response regulator
MDSDLLNVLHIEDDPDQQLSLRVMLQSARPNGFRFVQAGSLARGLECLAEHSFDLVIVDLNLPDSDEEQTLPTTLRHAGTVPVIVLSGNDSEEMAARFVQAGAQDFLVKGQTRPVCCCARSNTQSSGDARRSRCGSRRRFIIRSSKTCRRASCAKTSRGVSRSQTGTFARRSGAR